MVSTTKNKHIPRKIFLSLLGLLLILLAIFFLVDYGHYTKDPSPYRTLFIPRLELSLFEVTSLSADKTEMIGRVLIHNPLPFNLRADSLAYSVFISGVEVIKSTFPKSMDIKRWDSTWIELPVTIYNNKMTGVLKKAENEGKDSVVYRVETSFASNIIFHKQFNLDIEKLLPLIYIPETKLDKIEYDSLNFEGVSLFLHARITNKNKFALAFKNLKFKFALANDSWVSGEKDGVINIPDTSVTSLVLPLRISFKEIGKSIGPLIKHGKNTDYKFQATLQLVANTNAIKNSKVILNDEGAIKEIIKLSKEENKEAKEKKKREKEEGIKPAPKPKIKIEKKKDS